MIGWIRALAGGLIATAGATAVLSFAGCGSGSQPLAVVDPQAAAATPTFEQVRSILDLRCLGCHGGGGNATSAGTARVHPTAVAEDGEGADYSSCQGIVSGVEGILRTGVDGGSMPPGALPRLTETEKLIIRRWVQQGTCAPCNGCP